MSAVIPPGDSLIRVSHTGLRPDAPVRLSILRNDRAVALHQDDVPEYIWHLPVTDAEALRDELVAALLTATQEVVL